MDLNPYRAKIACFSKILEKTLLSFAQVYNAPEEEFRPICLDPTFLLSQYLLQFGDRQIAWLVINGQCIEHEMPGYCGAIVEIRLNHVHINMVNRTSKRRQCNFLQIDRDGKTSQAELDRFAHASREIYAKAVYTFSERLVKISTPKRGGDIQTNLGKNGEVLSLLEEIEGWYEHVCHTV